MSARLLMGVIVLIFVANTNAAELGRLFLSPAERAMLDRARRAAATPPAPAPPPEPTAIAIDLPPPPPEISLTVDGYIARSGGAMTVWINGADATAGALAEVGVAAERLKLEHSAVRVPLPSQQRGVLLKPGQSFDPASKHVSDAYEQAASAPASDAE